MKNITRTLTLFAAVLCLSGACIPEDKEFSKDSNVSGSSIVRTAHPRLFITSEDVKNLQEIQLHIAVHEDEEDNRIKRLSSHIDKKISDFFGFSDDMFNI